MVGPQFNSLQRAAIARVRWGELRGSRTTRSSLPETSNICERNQPIDVLTPETRLGLRSLMLSRCFTIFSRAFSGYFPLSTDFRLTILFHLVKCRPRCFNPLRSKRNGCSKAASQRAAAALCCFWHNQYGIKRNRVCLCGQVLLKMLHESRRALFSYAEEAEHIGIGLFPRAFDMPPFFTCS